MPTLGAHLIPKSAQELPTPTPAGLRPIHSKRSLRVELAPRRLRLGGDGTNTKMQMHYTRRLEHEVSGVELRDVLCHACDGDAFHVKAPTSTARSPTATAAQASVQLALSQRAIASPANATPACTAPTAER